METGIFILSRDIENPRPDRRNKDKWLASPTWEKGWKFSLRRVEHREVDLAERGDNAKVYHLKWLGYRFAAEVEFVERGAGGLECNYWRDEPKVLDTFTDLLGALVPSTDKYDEFKWQFLQDDKNVRDYGDDVLWQLYKAGKITNEDIALAMQAHDEETDREWAEQQAREAQKKASSS